MADRPSKHVGNAGDEPIVVVSIVNGDKQVFTIEPGGSLDIPLDDDEHAEHQARAAAFDPRAESAERRTREVIEILAGTDKWAARAVEEKVDMRADRVAYRQALRAKLGEIAKSSNPGAVKLPTPPSP
jgi:hypothetical protein